MRVLISLPKQFDRRLRLFSINKKAQQPIVVSDSWHFSRTASHVQSLLFFFPHPAQEGWGVRMPGNCNPCCLLLT